MTRQWIFAFVVCAATSLIASAQQAVNGSTQWQEYSYASEGFAIRLPRAIQPHPDSQLPNGVAFTVTFNATAALTLHVASFPNGCRDAYTSFTEPVKKAKRGDIRTPENSDFAPDFSSVREFQIDGHPALEFEQDIKSLQKRDYERYLCAGKRLYIFTAGWPKGQQRPTNLNDVLNSFRVLPSSHN